MKKILFLLLFLSLPLAGCASGEAVSSKQNKEDVPKTPKKESVIRSGRKDVLLRSDYVLKKLGKPEVKRYEPPSEVWVYPQKECVLLVYMAKQDDNSMLVRYLEIGTPTFKSKRKDSIPCLGMAAKLR